MLSKAKRVLDPEFLAEYELESEWAKGRGVSKRTAARYRELPNGLPYLVFGGAIWIPRREGAAWIANRIQRRNPSRRRQTAAAPAENQPSP
jgi:hypothetical protein